MASAHVAASWPVLRPGCRASEGATGGCALVGWGAECADKSVRRSSMRLFADEFGDHFDELRMCAGGAGAEHMDAEFGTELGYLGIEVV